MLHRPPATLWLPRTDASSSRDRFACPRIAHDPWFALEHTECAEPRVSLTIPCGTLAQDPSDFAQISRGAHPPASHRLRPPPPVPTARQPFSGVTPEVHLTSLRHPRTRAFESATLPESLRLQLQCVPPCSGQHKPNSHTLVSRVPSSSRRHRWRGKRKDGPRVVTAAEATTFSAAAPFPNRLAAFINVLQVPPADCWARCQ